MRTLYRPSFLILIMSLILVSCAAPHPKVNSIPQTPAATAVLASTAAAPHPLAPPTETSVQAQSLAEITRENAQDVIMLGFRGRGSVNDVDWSPDGRQIAIAASAGIFLVDAATYAETRLTGSKVTRSIAYSPDGNRLAAAEGSIVTILDATSGKVLQTFAGHASDVNSVAFSPDGSTVASGSEDRTIKLWDTASGKELRTLQGTGSFIYAVKFSPDGKLLLSNSNEKSSRLWDVASGKELRALKEDGPFSFSPDGKVLAYGSWSLTQETVQLSDAASGASLRTLEGTADQDVFANAISNSASAQLTIAYSPDGTILATTSWVNTGVKLWDVASGKELRRLAADLEGGYHLSFSPDGTRLITGSQTTIKIWDVASGKELRVLTGRPETVHVGGDEKGPGIPEGYGDMTNSVAFSPDGSLLASGHFNGAISLYEVSSGALLGEWKSKIGFVNSIAFSPDGKTIAAAGGRYNPIERGVQLWDMATQKPLWKLEDFSESVNSVAFSPDGTRLVTGWGHSWNIGGVKLWDAATGAFITEFGLKMLPNRSEIAPVSAIAFNPDGTLLAVATGGGRVLLWDMISAKEQAVLVPEGDPVELVSIAFSRDGAMLATAGYGESSTRADLRIWDVATGKQRIELTGHELDVFSVAFNKDDSLLASASLDGTVRLWDVKTGKVLAVINASRPYVLAFSPDGKLLATGGWDGSVQLWGVPGQ